MPQRFQSTDPILVVASPDRKGSSNRFPRAKHRLPPLASATVGATQGAVTPRDTSQPSTATADSTGQPLENQQRQRSPAGEAQRLSGLS